MSKRSIEHLLKQYKGRQPLAPPTKAPPAAPIRRTYTVESRSLAPRKPASST